MTLFSSLGTSLTIIGALIVILGAVYQQNEWVARHRNKSNIVGLVVMLLGLLISYA